MRTIITMTVLLTIAIIASIILGGELYKAKDNYKRIKRSFASSSQDLQYTKLENGKLAAKVDVLQLKHSELNKIFPEILNEIRNLNIKSKRVEYYSETIIKHEHNISSELKDSLLPDSNHIQYFDYKDEYYKVKGEIKHDSVRMNIISSDSLIQVVYRGKRIRPWLWFFSPRPLEQLIYSKNPNSKISYQKTIKLSK